MKICFVLPNALRKPIGGYKIIFEYSNRLINSGHDVSILFLNNGIMKQLKSQEFLRRVIVSVYTYIQPKWFKLNPKIRKYSGLDLKIKDKLKDVDVAIATGANTVDQTIEIFKDIRKAYFIQGYEEWIYPENDLVKTYGLGLDNIVISQWLKDIVEQYSNKPALLLKNPIDLEVYKPIKSIKSRNKFSIGVLYHTDVNKGFKCAFDALKRVKEIFPELQLKIFGTSKFETSNYDWIDFTYNASQKETVEIYNSVSIFVCASIREGFGLTGLEAMACGAALISTDYDGVKEYGISGWNALLSPVSNSELLADNIVDLITNDEKRLRIAQNGIETCKNYSWDNAIITLGEFLEKH